MPNDSFPITSILWPLTSVFAIILPMSDQPLDIRPVGDTELLILWPDSHRSLYPYPYLRLNCACAQCVDEWSGKRKLTLDKIPSDVRPLKRDSVGHYALRFDWSDGHNTGIYGFDFLRKICPCEACVQARAAQVKP